MIKNQKINDKKIFNSGFTLIELLIVIAIIGILSSVVLASLNSARVKGQIASIKSTLKNTIAQAELFYDTPGSYLNICSDSKISSMISSVSSNNGTSGCSSFDGTMWAVSTRLNSDATKNYAVSSSGVTTWDATDSGGGYVDWPTAVTACSSTGGRLPTPDEIKSLYVAYGSKPSIFTGTYYWSNISVPSDQTQAYYANSTDGTTVSTTLKTNTNRAHCVH